MAVLLVLGLGRAELRFRAQEIEKDLVVVYAVTVADVNGDGKPDVVAINSTQRLWFENSTWQKHVILDGATRRDNVCVAAACIDGDGKVDRALGAGWHPANTTSGVTLQAIRRPVAGPRQ